MELIAQAAKLPGETTKDEVKKQRNELDMPRAKFGTDFIQNSFTCLW